MRTKWGHDATSQRAQTQQQIYNRMSKKREELGCCNDTNLNKLKQLEKRMRLNIVFSILASFSFNKMVESVVYFSTIEARFESFKNLIKSDHNKINAV